MSSPRIQRLVETLPRWLSPVGVTGVLVPFVLLAFFAQPAADDFCVVSSIQSGFLNAQVWWYQNWTGRFAFIGVVTALSSIGEVQSSYWLGALFFLAATYFGGWWVIHRFSGPALTPATKFSAALIAFALFATGIPSPVQAFYWYSAAGAYQTGTVALVCLLAWMPWSSEPNPEARNAIRIVGLCSLAALTVGSHEQLMMVVTAFAIAAVAFHFLVRRALLKFSAPVLLVTLLADALVVAAPGNAARGAHFTGKQDFFGALAQSVLQAADFMLTWMGSLSLWAASFLTLLALPSIVNQRRYLGNPLRWFDLGRWLVPFGGTAVITGMFFVTWYVTGHAPTYRGVNSIYAIFLLTWFTTLATWVCFFLKTGVHIEANSPMLAATARIALVVALVDSANFHDAARSLLTAPAYRAAWTKRYDLVQIARQNAALELTFPKMIAVPKTIFFEDLTPDPDDWRNRCFAESVGMPALSVRVSDR